MTSVLAKNAVDGRDYYPKKFLQVDSEGIPIQGHIPKKIATVTTGVIDPLVEVQILSSAAVQTMTFPADLSNYVGRTFKFIVDPAVLRAHVITATTAGHLAGDLSYTFGAGAAGDKRNSVTYFVASPTHIAQIAEVVDTTAPTIA